MNIMSFAHFMTKRSMDRRYGSNRSYKQLFRWAMIDAYQAIRRNGLEALANRVAELKAIDARIANEKSVVRSIVSSALAMGYAVSLYDGEEWAIKQSRSLEELMNGVMSTDCDTLQFRKMHGDPKPVGRVFLVYGNSASEVMNDWTDNAETNAILKNAIKQCERFAAKGL